MNPKITKEVVDKINRLLDKGLTCGLGIPKPGKMCVEAAICYAFGEPHDDRPRCVAGFVSRIKITLNDLPEWGNKKNRAEGLRRAAIAQLGSKGVVDEKVLSHYLFFGAIQKVLPIALRSIGEFKLAAQAEKVNTDKRVFELSAAVRSLAHSLYPVILSNHIHSDAYDLYTLNFMTRELVERAKSKAIKLLLLQTAAEVLVQALIKCKSPGAKFL